MNNNNPIRYFFRKWFSMPLCVGLLLISGQIQAVSAQGATKVNLTFEHAELKDILEEIKAQTQFDFVYNAQDIDDKSKISLNLKNTELETALKSLLHPIGISFTIQDQFIVLQKKAMTAPQASWTVKGKVVDQQGQPLPGVSVRIKGTLLGVVTDNDGLFSIVVPAGTGTPELLFSFIGMRPEMRKVTKDENLRVVMHEMLEELNEVIVTGMETIKKERMTGSATVVTAKDLQMQGVTSLDRILEGRIAGLNSTTVSGAPGTRAKITIRGENNLSGNTEPLWIVDGLPMMSGVPESTTGDYAGTIMQDGVGNIMPDDIESISILKDASAAAIYGARAANGVIVITTKKGFRSKLQVNYSGTYNCGIQPRNRLNFMNTTEKLQYEKSIIENFGLNRAENAGRGGYLLQRHAQGYLTDVQYRQQLDALSKINTDWFDVLFRTSQSHSHSISLRGGSEELTYYTSVNFTQQNGILRNNQYQNAGVLSKLDYRPVKNLILALNISANTRKNEDHASAINPFQYAVFANPYERPYDENGNYVPDLSYLPDNYSTQTASGYLYHQFNILRELNETRETQTGLDAEITFNLRYEIIPGLSAESIIRKGISYNTTTKAVNAGTYTSWVNETLARDIYKKGPLPEEYNNGELSESSGKNHNWSIRNQIDYSFSLKDAHLVSFMIANEIMSKKFNNFGYTSPIYYDDYRITGIPTFNTDASYEALRVHLGNLFHTTDGQDRSVSFIGTMRYGYKDRYIVNFNYRADGADMIGDANRFAPLWSVGARYNLHKEKWFKNKIVNELSLRASYGFTGNIDRSAYPFSRMGIGSNLYLGNRYVTSLEFPNPDIKWEKKKDRNFGLDLALFNNRINFTADYYFNRTTDVLENLAVPNSTGRTQVKANGGIVENKGLELYLNVKWVNTGDLTFSTSVNLARNKNVIKKSRYAYSSYSDAVRSEHNKGGVLNIIGKETGSIFGWKYTGVNPVTGNPQYALTPEGKRAYAATLDGWDQLYNWQKEEYKDIITSFTEVPNSTDFIRNEWSQFDYFMSSMQYLGRTNPKYVGGFNTYIKYKGIEFTTSWTFKTGHLIPNFNDYKNAPNDGSDLKVSATNREKKYLNYWKAQGDVTDVPRFVESGSDYWAYDMCVSNAYSKGDYLRMTNLSLSYRFPGRLVSRWKLNNLTFGFNARNLLTFTKYRGLDVATEGAFTYPVSRDFNFKVTVGF